MGSLQLRCTCQNFLIDFPNNAHRHDNIAETLGVMAPPFEMMFNTKAMEMQRLVLNYVKALQAMLPAATGIPGAAPTASKTTLKIHNGLPKLPRDFDLEDYLRKDLEAMYHKYIATHYCRWFST